MRMEMTDFIIKGAIPPILKATTSEGVVRELVQSLHEAGQFAESDIDDIVSAVLRREQLSTTGIGRGIAIPHSRHGSTSKLTGTIGISKSGIPFDSIDGEAVSIITLVISPQDRPVDHLRALECIVQCFSSDDKVHSLRQAETRDEVWNLIGGAS